LIVSIVSKHPTDDTDDTDDENRSTHRNWRASKHLGTEEIFFRKREIFSMQIKSANLNVESQSLISTSFSGSKSDYFENEHFGNVEDSLLRKTQMISALCVMFLSACGTTFSIPEAVDLETSSASRMFEAARADTTRTTLSSGSAESRFNRVARRVEPAGRKVCKEATANLEDFNCNVNIAIDRSMTVRNAYFTYQNGEPIIRLSLPLVRDTQSDDEVAFVMSHEFGHLIGRHIEKQEQQAMVGAIILGTITAYGNAYSASAGQYYDPNAVANNMELGAAAGALAYSQTYELESDTLGTYIAQLAGYDPIEGAQFFARPEEARTSVGTLSFWGTHPPDEKRLATVIAAVRSIKENGGLILSSSNQPR
jgi:Zn-dependent protease with chaperone function